MTLIDVNVGSSGAVPSTNNPDRLVKVPALKSAVKSAVVMGLPALSRKTRSLLTDTAVTVRAAVVYSSEATV